jgi:hypothetical protein
MIAKKGTPVDSSIFAKLLLAGYKQVSVLPASIKYAPELYTRSQIVTKGHDNWFSNLGHENIFEQISRGGLFGQTDKLEDPRARLMAGKLLNIGKGYDVPKEKANAMHTNMQKLFEGMNVKKKRKK